MPPASTDVTKSLSRSSATTPTQTLTPVFTTINVPASPSFVTTTVTSVGSGSFPTLGAVSNPVTSAIPVAAIAGGTAAGVAIALVAVIGWTWWGRCIKRKAAKERKQALAFLQVRENTRRNASTLSHPAPQYRPAFSTHSTQERKVTFASRALSSSQSTLRGTVETKKGPIDSEKAARHAPPRPPTPTAQVMDAHNRHETGMLPPLPHRNPQRERVSIEPFAVPDPIQHRLIHQASTLSSGSVYSTQSALADGQSAVPSSLLSALANDGNRRSLLASYLPWNRYRTSVVSNNRLSEYSTGSVYSQLEDLPWESVGFAYGGEDELPRG
ncbi:hypothetical protein LXA43DRAFT_466881 [Ganoderma leucocontextum]|nr:hypothetical protein LXA43DRAFT_466881 [Ganoderma leucocontextum]